MNTLPAIHPAPRTLLIEYRGHLIHRTPVVESTYWDKWFVTLEGERIACMWVAEARTAIDDFIAFDESDFAPALRTIAHDDVQAYGTVIWDDGSSTTQDIMAPRHGSENMTFSDLTGTAEVWTGAALFDGDSLPPLPTRYNCGHDSDVFDHNALRRICPTCRARKTLIVGS